MSALNLSKKKEPKPKKEPRGKEKKGKEKVAKVKVAPKPKVKVPADKYTLILLFSLLALIAATVMIYLDLQSYQ